MCVNTIVLTSPMRPASHAAAKCENTVIVRAATNSSASSRLVDAEARVQVVGDQRRADEAAADRIEHRQQRELAHLAPHARAARRAPSQAARQCGRRARLRATSAHSSHRHDQQPRAYTSTVASYACSSGTLQADRAATRATPRAARRPRRRCRRARCTGQRPACARHRSTIAGRIACSSACAPPRSEPCVLSMPKNAASAAAHSVSVKTSSAPPAAASSASSTRLRRRPTLSAK